MIVDVDAVALGYQVMHQFLVVRQALVEAGYEHDATAGFVRVRVDAQVNAHRPRQPAAGHTPEMAYLHAGQGACARLNLGAGQAFECDSGYSLRGGQAWRAGS